MIKPFYYVCKVDENDWEICYDNGFGETVESRFYTQQEAEDAARKLNSGMDKITQTQENNMLVGSRAIAHWNPDFKIRLNSDWDIIGTPESETTHKRYYKGEM